jgi:hypothetical protein
VVVASWRGAGKVQKMLYECRYDTPSSGPYSTPLISVQWNLMNNSTPREQFRTVLYIYALREVRGKLPNKRDEATAANNNEHYLTC